ncbi:MAG: patatin-like phospholipase family protein [Pseudomonadota bacterium]
MVAPAPPTKTIDLALQGGGSHGALTWGVLDRLLEDPRIDVGAISGTSAGAMNAVVLAAGLQRGGREGARTGLDAFWKRVSEAARFSPIQRSIWSRLTHDFSLENSPTYHWFEHVTRLFSPYQLNPLDINPLRDLVRECVDFTAVNACEDVRVFVTATNVRSGRPHIFTQPDLSVETVMASACLPFVFQAVEIDGEPYWDGGYVGNPALYPLVDDPRSRDLVVVQINPLHRYELPTTGRAILNRLNEITFNASLIKELRAIELLRQLIEAENLELERFRDMHVHLIHAHEDLQDLDASSKLNAEWSYLLYLKQRGRTWAERFLDAHFDDLGERSTFDVNRDAADSFRPVHHRPRRAAGAD